MMLIESWLPTPFAWCYIPSGVVRLTAHRAVEISNFDPEALFDVPAFYIAKYPVTNAQFDAFIVADGYRTQDYWTSEGWAIKTRQEWEEPRYRQIEKWKGADHPVVGVSWYEASAFCRWLTMTGGASIRLPTEQEWQRAAQGDNGRTYPWGNRFDPTLVNTKEGGIRGTTPVTRYPQGASPYGVLDMSGNVWEWCATEYILRDSDKGIVSYRCLRGGSWLSGFEMANVTYRSAGNPADDDYDRGFRIVLAGDLT